MLFFLDEDDDPPDLFDEEVTPERPPLDDLRDELPPEDDVLRDELAPDVDRRDEPPPDADLRDEPPPDDDELLDLFPEEELFDPPLDDEREPPLLDPVELFDELERPPVEDFDEPPDLLREDEVDDFELPEELDERPPEVDLDPPLLLLARDEELFPPADRPPLRDDDERVPLVVVMVSAAAPIAPIAAPDAAPLIISPATSITLSTIADVVLFDRDDLPRDVVDEEEPLLREPPDLDLLAITFPPNDRNK